MQSNSVCEKFIGRESTPARAAIEVWPAEGVVNGVGRKTRDRAGEVKRSAFTVAGPNHERRMPQTEN